MPETTRIKEEARRLVDELPEKPNFINEIIEEGIADLDAGITWTSDQIRDKLGIPK